MLCFFYQLSYRKDNLKFYAICIESHVASFNYMWKQSYPKFYVDLKSEILFSCWLGSEVINIMLRSSIKIILYG